MALKDYSAPNFRLAKHSCGWCRHLEYGFSSDRCVLHPDIVFLIGRIPLVPGEKLDKEIGGFSREDVVCDDFEAVTREEL